MNHPCNHYSCMENYHGECYGGGCKLNPEPSDENENKQEDGSGDSNN